jgi:hypothetical protein
MIPDASKSGIARETAQNIGRASKFNCGWTGGKAGDLTGFASYFISTVHLVVLKIVVLHPFLVATN